MNEKDATNSEKKNEKTDSDENEEKITIEDLIDEKGEIIDE